jgi:glycerol-3-phosphate O-acyltransferase
VIEVDRLLDRFVLEDVAAREGWPAPQLQAQVFAVRRMVGFFERRAVPNDVAALEPLVARDRAHGGGEHVHFVPVAIFWGRAPQREQSWLQVLLAEDWAFGGRLRRFFAVMIHGRDVLVKAGDPIAAAALAADDRSNELMARKLGRLLRVFFNEQRGMTVGPDLSHRRLLLDEVLANPLVVAAVRREVRSSAGSERRVQAKARKFAAEIAADYSYPVVRLLDRAFTWLWNRLYDGVEVRHVESLRAIAPGSELVYVPCHRSHIDYMLLAYVIYRHGLAPPHIAAGINLNLPIVGRVLRRGGAFFIRRSFHGNALYSAVFRSYFRLILARGFPVKYFIEGTRSRTGRLLAPKLGLLTMTIQSYLADRARPIVFVPVYFGYEKLIEGQTFIGELGGASKQRETLFGFLRSLKALRERFGGVQVSFGEPLKLEALLDEVHAGWRNETIEEPFRPEWVGEAAAELGRRVLVRINEAAVLNPVNLVALVVLAMPKRAIVEVELEAQLALYAEIARRAPYAPRTGATALDARAMIASCEELGWLARRKHSLGDVLSMDERCAALASYYRNNVLHVFALPALVAAAFGNRAEIGTDRLHAFVAELYPCLRGELYLRVDAAALPAATAAASDAMLGLELLAAKPGVLARPPEGGARAAQLKLCAEIVRPLLEHYYMAVALLLAHGQGALRAAELVERCTAAAQQLALIYAASSPDLAQAELFRRWVAYLAEAGFLIEQAGGKLGFDAERLAELGAALEWALPVSVRQTLENLAVAAIRPPSGASPPGGSAAPV